jgi:4-hydroxybenzoate polyprenyltransferase
MRPINIVVSATAAIMSAYILGNFHYSLITLYTLLVVVFYTGGANAFNDYCDYEIDLINRPNRPLSRGLINSNEAFIFSIVFFLIGSLVALLLPLKAMMVSVGIALPLLIVYSLRLKGVPIIGNMVVSMILGLSFIFFGLSHGNILPMLVPSFLAFGLTFLRELIKDIADIEGDKENNLKTLPIVIGEKKSISVSYFLIFIIGFGSLMPYYFNIYGNYYLILLILGVEVPLFIIIYYFMKLPTINSAKKSANLLKFSVIAGLIAIFTDYYVR